MHIDAVKLHEELKRDGGIRVAFDHIREMEEASLDCTEQYYTCSSH